ncbi:hypothetical protein [Bacillus marinisedimentorum]|uniref:hypothetical protein n=1 Tax=Bacillus marinisedimentorum TaxID=1821260 RepID=UPI0008723DE2|nr:hypothetical protein [Bacillus marinisedimentorum]
MEPTNTIKRLFGDSFNILNGLPISIQIEEVRPITNFTKAAYENKLQELMEYTEKLDVKRIGFLLNAKTPYFPALSEMLKASGFKHYASRVEVYLDLKNVDANAPDRYEWRSLEDKNLTEEKFMSLWEQAMSGSDNAPSTLPIAEHLESVRRELGPDWKRTCNAIYEDGNAIAISMPHIEPGTIDEGRLFYFGLLPESRGTGKSAEIHRQSLGKLKEMGASHYAGGTHRANTKMQKVFQRNGCTVRTETESYYKTFNKK